MTFLIFFFQVWIYPLSKNINVWQFQYIYTHIFFYLYKNHGCSIFLSPSPFFPSTPVDVPDHWRFTVDLLTVDSAGQSMQKISLIHQIPYPYTSCTLRCRMQMCSKKTRVWNYWRPRAFHYSFYEMKTVFKYIHLLFLMWVCLSTASGIAFKNKIVMEVAFGAQGRGKKKACFKEMGVFSLFKALKVSSGLAMCLFLFGWFSEP